MSKHYPPVPPASRSAKGVGGLERQNPNSEAGAENDRPRNLDEQGQQGNIRQNTTHQGYQQDR